MTTTPEKYDLKNLTKLLDSNERITLSGKNYFKIINSLLFGMLFSGIVVSCALVYSDLIALQVLVILGLIGVSLFLFLHRYVKRIRSASIIGESLIMNSSRKETYVTTLNTVKKVTTHTILFVHCTFLTYSLDGRIHKTIFIGNPPKMAINLDNFILYAQRWSKNKRQTISRVQ